MKLHLITIPDVGTMNLKEMLDYALEMENDVSLFVDESMNQTKDTKIENLMKIYLQVQQ